jgi:hypothetical protein
MVAIRKKDGLPVEHPSMREEPSEKERIGSYFKVGEDSIYYKSRGGRQAGFRPAMKTQDRGDEELWKA